MEFQTRVQNLHTKNFGVKNYEVEFNEFISTRLENINQEPS